MAKKHTLYLDLEPDLDFGLIGVISPLKGYRLCHLLNLHLEADFARMEKDLSCYAGTKDQQAQVQFPRYRYFDPVTRLHCFLVESKIEHVFLIPELKAFDYLVIFRGPHWEKYAGFGVEQMKKIKQIQMVRSLDPEKIKSIENIIFDDETN